MSELQVNVLIGVAVYLVSVVYICFFVDLVDGRSKKSTDRRRVGR